MQIVKPFRGPDNVEYAPGDEARLAASACRLDVLRRAGNITMDRAEAAATPAPGGPTYLELRAEAKRLEIPGYSRMKAGDLAAAVAKAKEAP